MAAVTDPTEHERELREQWQLSHLTLHAKEQEALLLARRDIDRRLEEMNQFRDQIARERGEFIRRDVHDQQYDTMRDAVDTRLKILEQSKSNLEGRMWAMGAVITGIAVALNLLMHYLGK